MTSAEFVPAFREDVYIDNPDGSKTQVNPKYCATDQCAEDLRQIFQDLGPVVTKDWPLTSQWGGNFAASDKVPYLVFPGGTAEEPERTVRENAGQLANLWVINPDPAVAERSARQDIQNLMRGN